MKLKIAREVWNDRLGVLLYYESNGKRYVVKPVDLVVEEQKEGIQVEPTFRIDGRDQNEFIKSMAEMAEEMGIKTDTQLQEETKNKGVLEATKYHLEDMRTLVFKKSDNGQ